jgi:hypothetical protein
MKKFTLKHEINCSADHFWKVFFDNDFNMKLYLEALEFPEFVVLEQTETDSSVRRRVRGRPKMDVPKAVAKVLGESFGYEEEGNWDASTKVWTWKMTPNRLQGKIRNDGRVTIEAIDDNTCRRVADLEVEAKIFGVGGLIETTSEKQLRDGWDKSAVFFNRWLKDHPPE